MLNLFCSFSSSEFWMRSAKRSIRLSCWSWLESIRELASRTAPSIDPSRHHRRRRRFQPWAASPAIISSKSIREIKKFYSQDGFKSVVELRSKIFQNKVSALSSTWAFFDSRTLTQNDDRLFDSARRRRAETFEWKASSLIKKKNSVSWTFCWLHLSRTTLKLYASSPEKRRRGCLHAMCSGIVKTRTGRIKRKSRSGEQRTLLKREFSL